MELKYKFIAIFEDQTVIEQTPADKSIIDPSRSSFFDVLQSEKTLKTFTLNGDGHSYTVDLSDGHFEIDGIPFEVEGDSQLPSNNPIYRLVFWRTHQINNQEKIDRIHSYMMGWQTTIDGKNYQQIIRIK